MLVKEVPEGNSSLVPNYNEHITKISEDDIKIAETADPRSRFKVFDSITEVPGDTPLVRLHNIEKHYGISPDVEIIAKLEYLNPGGSIKDRVARNLVIQAETRETMKPGDVFIEPSSGNTGIGLAINCAAKDYKLVVTMLQKISTEKSRLLEALGVEVVRTPTQAMWNERNSHIGTAYAIKEKLTSEGFHCALPDQYQNSANAATHFCMTAPEILRDIGPENPPKVIVCSTGTGGTITGIGARIKQDLPSCKIVGADPEGSIMSRATWNPEDVKPVQVEGIGHGFKPSALDSSFVDEWCKVRDADSFAMARLLIRREGILCGGSSGTAVFAAVEQAKKMTAEGTSGRIVVIIPDGINNYMSKFVDDRWMIINGFMEISEAKDWERRTRLWKNVELPAKVANRDLLTTVLSTSKVVDVLDGGNWMVVINSTGGIEGCFSKAALVSMLTGDRLRSTDSLLAACNTPVVCISPKHQTPCECYLLSEALEECCSLKDGILLAVDASDPELSSISSTPGTGLWRKEMSMKLKTSTLGRLPGYVEGALSMKDLLTLF